MQIYDTSIPIYNITYNSMFQFLRRNSHLRSTLSEFLIQIPELPALSLFSFLLYYYFSSLYHSICVQSLLLYIHIAYISHYFFSIKITLFLFSHLIESEFEATVLQYALLQITTVLLLLVWTVTVISFPDGYSKGGPAGGGGGVKPSSSYGPPGNALGGGASKPSSSYGPPGKGGAGGIGGGFGGGGGGAGGAASGPIIPIIKLESRVNHDGTFMVSTRH